MEAHTYRAGPHTSADDPSRYRDLAETDPVGFPEPEPHHGTKESLELPVHTEPFGTTPILNHPRGAMLGVSRLWHRPWIVDGPRAIAHLPRRFLPVHPVRI